MAQTESRIRLVFDGVERGVAAAAAKSSAAIKKLGVDNDRLAVAANKSGIALGEVGIGLAKVGVAGNAMSAALSVGGGAAGALSQLAPAALLLPGALLAGAAAMQTFKLATNGFGEAVGAGLSGDLEAFAEATKKMHPEMAKAAGEVVKLKPRLDDLKKTVQGKFWDGFSKEIAKTADNILPALSRELPGIAEGFNRIGKSALQAAQTGFFKSDIQIILFNTGKTLKNMGSVAADALTGFVRLGAAGSSYLPRLGKAIDQVATKFANWTEKITDGDDSQFHQWVEGAITGFKDLAGIVKNVGSSIGSVFKGLGGDMRSPLASLRELTGQVAAFLKTAAAQDGLKMLGETLRVVGEVVGRVVMTALRELMPTLVELAPVAQEVARTLGDLLVSALETLGPIIRGVASVFNTFPGLVGPATVAVVGFVAAVKTMQAVNAATTALAAFRAGLAGTAASTAAAGTSAAAAGAGFAAMRGKLLKFGAVAGLAVVAAQFGEIDVKARGSADSIGHARDAVGQFTSAAASLDLGFFFDQFIEEAKFGAVVWQQFKNMVSGWQPDPIKFDVNVGPAQEQVTGFMNSLKGKVGTVNINGRTEDASQALANIVQAINAGQGEVDINGTKVPAQQALDQVIRQIDTAGGMVDINGNKVPAGQALAGFLSQANSSRGTVQVGANTAGANSSVSGFVSRWNGYTIRMNAVVSSRIGGLAAGGPVVGPGSGTSDTAGLFALSNGEYVATARQVDAAGGPSAFGRLMGLLERGEIRHLAGGGETSPIRATAQAAMRTPPAVRASSGRGAQVTFSGNTSDALATVIMSMIRTNKIQIKAA
jgi:hypothetical protein